MKSLKFDESLVPLILSEEKITTWRIDNEKDFNVGEIVSLCSNNSNEFAKGKIISIKKTFFRNLTIEDVDGHENFISENEMYKTYSKYYNKKIDSHTKLDVIKYKLLK